jgi:hypothetical protein
VKAIEISCLCGAVKVQIKGEAVEQFYCHCDDCQAVSGGAYIGVAVFPSDAVTIAQGAPVAWRYKVLPRRMCGACGTQLTAEVPGFDQTGVKANLLPKDVFKPKFHINCRYALLPVKDDLPHFKGFPAKFGGSDETVDW